MKLLAIKASIMEQDEVEISMCKAYKARKIANEMINGRFEDNYLRIRDYSEELKVSNPTTTTKSLCTPNCSISKGSMFVWMHVKRVF